MIADIIVIAIALLSAYMGYKRGFIKTISRLCCIVISFIVAKFLNPYVSAYVRESFIGDFIYEKIANSADAALGENIPLFMKKAGEYTANGIADTAVSIVSVLAIIIVTYLVANFIVGALNVVAKFPVISFFNKICGLATGVFTGILITYILMAIASVSDFALVNKWFDGSAVAYKMYTDNILMNLFF